VNQAKINNGYILDCDGYKVGFDDSRIVYVLPEPRNISYFHLNIYNYKEFKISLRAISIKI